MQADGDGSNLAVTGSWSRPDYLVARRGVERGFGSWLFWESVSELSVMNQNSLTPTSLVV